ncbi:MAG TPA: NADH-quinone oxidoreductase subunit NuoE [Porticoccaceae bacterium]|nr:NADH-quinone oxidoreductase subunit NuoE [Porticoccaceae bacterium]
MSQHLIQTDVKSTLSTAEIAAIDAEIAHLPYTSAAAIDALKIVQAARGWVSDECLIAIAKHLDMSVEQLEGIATFYNLIYRQPVGDKVILFCNSVSCWICDCDKVKERISDLLEIDYGETTTNNRYTLLPVPCLGACDRAPVMMVGDDLITHLDDEIIETLFGPNQQAQSD